MNCLAYEELLGDYVDGTLRPEDERRVASHVAECARCKAMVTDFSTLRTAARALDPVAPAAHVWTRLAASIEAEPQRRGRWSRLFSLDALTVGFLGDMAGAPLRPALAAMAMVAVLAGGTWLAWREVSRVQSAPQAPASVVAASAAAAQAAATFETELKLAEEHYTKAIASLEQITKADSGALDMKTAEVLQANLAVIDSAIGQSREALQKEPASQVAQESLFDALRSKVVLLQNTVALINEMRKGNSEGAARIMSGLKQ